MALLFILFCVTRLILILNLPPFTDESMFIRWGLLMIDNPQFRWASIQYISRQPLAFWLFGIGARFVGNPLIGARFVTLVFSIPSFFAVYKITQRIASSRQAMVSLAVFSLCPIFILLQSLALMDGIILSVGVIILLLIIEWCRKPSWVFLAMLGVLEGLLLWIKSTAVIIVILTTVSILYSSIRQKQRLPTACLRAAFPFVMACIILIPLLIRPDIGFILGEPSDFTQTPAELFRFPILTWAQFVTILAIGLIIYLSPPVVLCAAMGWKHIKKGYRAILSLWLVVPIAITVVTGTFFRFRYFAFALPALLPWVNIATLPRVPRTASWIILAALAGLLIIHPRTFFAIFPYRFPKLLEREYAYDWTAGFGTRDAVNYINDHLTQTQSTIYVAVPDVPGNPTDFILATYFYHPTVRATLATTTNESDFRKLEPLTKQGPTYLVTRSGLANDDIQQFLKPVIIFQKTANEEAAAIFKVAF